MDKVPCFNGKSAPQMPGHKMYISTQFEQPRINVAQAMQKNSSGDGKMLGPSACVEKEIQRLTEVQTRDRDYRLKPQSK
jgi:hypothetical protein